MPSTDPGIICFQHCGAKVFCITLPERCLLCGVRLHDAQFRLLPFRLPYPFARASQYPCAVVLRPTTGDFLNEYYNATDLHIGVTTSNGAIVEFDRGGLRRHSNTSSPTVIRAIDDRTTVGKKVVASGEAWTQCLVVESVPEPWAEHWDATLLQICRQTMTWTAAAYRENSHNCYSFVLKFLQALDYGELSMAACNRTVFCEKYIVPRTTTAGKYISLYRKIRDQGHYVHNANGGTVMQAANRRKSIGSVINVNNSTNTSGGSQGEAGDPGAGSNGGTGGGGPRTIGKLCCIRE